MRAKLILHDLFGRLLDKVHKRRMKTVFSVVEAILRERCLSLTAVGRSLASIEGLEKHAIKRVDRLLGNRHLYNELNEYFRSIAAIVIGDKKHCLVLVDWTGVHANLSVLSASIPVGGRSIGIYHEVHEKRLESDRKVLHRFLDRLSAVIPSGCIPIVVTDAGTGFRNPWFRKIRTMGWHYVGRSSSTFLLQVSGSSEWKAARSFFSSARQNIPVDVGPVTLTRSRALRSRLVVYKASAKGRKGHRGSNRKRVHPGMCSYKKYQKRNREPWLLYTSLEANKPLDIVRIYATRMQCEEFFRDAKSHRFGLGFEDVRTKSAERTSIILLLSTLAQMISLLIGQVAERQRLSRHFQANTVRNRRVISQAYLGLRILLSIQRWKLSIFAIRTAIRAIQRQFLPQFNQKNFSISVT